jgi:hypothetical protein
MKTEIVPFGRVIWQSDTAKTYQCPQCLSNVRTQYEGDESPRRIVCHGPMADHVVEWSDEKSERVV